jgi:hypothetical protein
MSPCAKRLARRLTLTVREPLFAKDDRDSLWSKLYLLLHPSMDATAFRHSGGVTPFNHELMALRGVEKRQGRQRPPWISEHGLEQTFVVLKEPQGGAVIEKVGIVFEQSRQPALLFVPEEREIELGYPQLDREGAHPEVASRQTFARLVLQYTHDLEKRVPAHVPLGL